MSVTNNVKYKELLVWRMSMAIASSIAVQFFFLNCVIFITRLNLVHPLSWIHDTWEIVTSLRTCGYFLILAIVIFLQGIICSKNYFNVPPYLKSRFVMFCNMFMPHNLLVGGLHVLVSSTLVWLHLSLENGRYDWITTNHRIMHGSYLSEEHFFLLLGGLWTGLYFFAKTNFYNLAYLQFPIIPQSKLSQIKRGIVAMLPSTMLSAVWPVLYFMGFYYIMGGYCRRAVQLTLLVPTEEKPLDKFSGLLNLSLIFHSWLYTSLFVLTMNTMRLLFQVHFTEWVAFEIGQPGIFQNASSDLTLSETLALNKVPIIQHLGYLDLATLAQKEKFRRSMLFVLSQPGGHPYNWNYIVEKCLTLINGFVTELNAACSLKEVYRPSSSSMLTVPNVQLIEPENPCPYNMRNLVAMKTLHDSVDETASSQCPSNEQIIIQFFQNKKQSFVAYLLSKPLINYIFGEQIENKVRHILFNGQLVIWAADAISSLTVMSLTEDPFGIVQNDVPVIIETLLALKQSLDKLQKINILTKKSQSNDKLMRQTIASLRGAAKRSIYRITCAYKNYIKDLTLKPSTMDQLRSFLTYRE